MLRSKLPPVARKAGVSAFALGFELASFPDSPPLTF